MTKRSLYNLVNSARLSLVEFLVSKLTYINIMEEETKVEGEETPVEMPMGEEEVTPEGEMPSEATEEEAM